MSLRGTRSPSRSGFSLVEVVIASSVLVIALFGILSMAFHTYRKTDVADEAITAANLAAERLAYFRSHEHPFLAAGGTFYRPPATKGMLDLNQLPSKGALHNVWNKKAVLLVREWLYSTTEQRFKTAAGDDEGRQHMNDRSGLDATKRINFIPPVPSFVTIGGDEVPVAGVFPNWGGTDAAPGNQEELNHPISLDGATQRSFVFVPAPRANDTLRGFGANVTNVPASIRYVREVWVQTNSPLGSPYTGADDESVRAVGITYPAFYTNAPGKDIAEKNITRSVTAAAASGLATIRMPKWVLTVTVRVFSRNPKVKDFTDSASLATASIAGTKLSGLGYDPTKPLATVVGYFGVRHQLGVE